MVAVLEPRMTAISLLALPRITQSKTSDSVKVRPTETNRAFKIVSLLNRGTKTTTQGASRAHSKSERPRGVEQTFAAGRQQRAVSRRQKSEVREPGYSENVRPPRGAG